MKLPEKYPDGFVAAATKEDSTIDMDVVMEGLNFYVNEFAELYNSTWDVEGHLIIAAMLVFIKSVTDADPLSRPAAKALLRYVKVEATVCKVIRKKK